jgi:sec-independent protein translocase protein TatA
VGGTPAGPSRISDCKLPKGAQMLEGIFQPMHLLVILFIALMVFGPKKLPELGRGLGDGIRSFKDSMRDEKRDEASKTSVESETLPVKS